ncbi:MAG: ATP-binding protein, partial [Chitinophagaceae bacterium]
MQSEDSTWRYTAAKGEEGAQIDLLIDCIDSAIYVSEMKYYTAGFTIDKRYAGELERKLKVFADETKTKKSIFLTMVTTYGVQSNDYAKN